ncbi:MAG: low molecular weight protein-tyrosine-phosphatase [Paraglaciecola sp.]|uniref:low molecular weight protein-tyrosine-phosphatase n=1 Tax=Paraglaciecola sp. TaxID=1920173 RepID=UPI003299BEFB
MQGKKISVLFVCLGNICRSPSAEAVFKKKALEAGLDLIIDSAGTAGYHTGASPDKRSQSVGIQRGYSFEGINCRKVAKQDFEKFDYILGMDNENITNLLAVCPEGYEGKVELFLNYAQSEEDQVPDPYYGGKRGFEYVLDLIELASTGLIQHIKNK